ncbi:MAG: thioredoxin fold domain-containing protein [Planctomycetota bacterium]
MPATAAAATPTTTRAGFISAANAIFLAVIVAIVAVLIVVRGNNAPPAESIQDGLFTTTSFTEAQTRAAADDKLVFVLATADWCPPCRSLRAGALADAGVQSAVNAQAVAYKLDVTDSQTMSPADSQLAQTLNVSSIPALYVIDNSNNVLATTVGDMSASRFTNWFKAAAAAAN